MRNSLMGESKREVWKNNHHFYFIRTRLCVACLFRHWMCPIWWISLIASNFTIIYQPGILCWYWYIPVPLVKKQNLFLVGILSSRFSANCFPPDLYDFLFNFNILSFFNCLEKLTEFDILQVDLRHMDEKTDSNIVETGVDLSEFYMSVEWDIIEVPAVR